MNQKLAEAKKALAAIASVLTVLIAAGALTGVGLTVGTAILAVAGALGVGTAVYATKNAKGA